MSQMLERLFYSKMGQSLLSAMGMKPAPEVNRYNGEIPWACGTIALAEPPSSELAHVLDLCDSKFEVLKENERYNSLLIDASGYKTVEDLNGLKRFFQMAMPAMNRSAHIAILGLNPETSGSVEQASVMTALNGFTRSLAKELGRKGITANVLYLDSKADGNLCVPLMYFLSNRATYVTGQPIYIGTHENTVESHSWEQPLKGKIALVTGAAQGIGAAIAETLARDGATIIGLDIPPAKETLEKTLAPLNGICVATDITSDEATADIEKALAGRNLDILVHNAGVTRDKTLSKMPDHFWDMTLNINLTAPLKITQQLEQNHSLSHEARVICISSISGLAGNVGQTNYSASKSGVAGYVREQAKKWNGSGKTINAIAPGFIETQMTDQIPFMTREMGRRMNSLSQGGKPQDVAEGVALFAQPGSGALNGQVLRVCGQSLIGA